MNKCARVSCDNPEQSYIHLLTNKKYCKPCAAKINKKHADEYPDGLIVHETKIDDKTQDRIK